MNKDLELIVGTCDRPLLFSSVATAEAYLEGIDIENGEYTYALSPEGQFYHLLSDGANGVIILPDREAAREPQRAWEILARLVRSRGIEVREDADLANLIAQCQSLIDDGVT